MIFLISVKYNTYRVLGGIATFGATELFLWSGNANHWAFVAEGIGQRNGKIEVTNSLTFTLLIIVYNLYKQTIVFRKYISSRNSARETN